MKIRNSSRITAIVLALMMIVPLISVPAVAATKVDGTKATAIVSNDFESYEEGTLAAGNGLNATPQAPSNAVIATLEGNNVLKFDLTPAMTHKDSDIFVKGNINADGKKKDKDTWFIPTYELDFAKDENGEFIIDEETQDLIIVYDGTVNVHGTTLYFNDAVLNDVGAVTACVLYTDEACTQKYTGDTFHLCTAQVRNAIQGATNIAQPSFAAGTENLAGNYFVFSADYYFDSAIANKTFDFRVHSNIHFGHFVTSASGVTVKLHADIGDGRLYDPGYTVPKGEWFTLTIVADATDGKKTKITMYVNGEMAAYGELSTVLATTGNGWNLGHVQRGGNVDTYYGTYYVDNVAVYNTADVIPADWEGYNPNKIYSENFEKYAANSTALPSSLVYLGTGHKIDNSQGSTAFMVDFDTWDEVAGANGNGFGNLDQNLILNTSAVNSGIVSIKVDYFIPEGASLMFQSQLRSAGGKVDGVSNSNIQWIDLFQFDVYNGVGSIKSVAGGDSSNPIYYNKSVPVGEWFTVESVIDLATAEYSLLINGVTAATATLHKGGELTDLTITASGTNSKAGIIVCKMNWVGGSSSNKGPTHSKYPDGYKGYVLLDNISVNKIDDMPGVILGGSTADFEDKTAGTAAPAPSNTPTAGPSTATYIDFMGTNAVQISMLGQTEATKLETPFIAINARSYDIDITNIVEFVEPEAVTLDFLNSLTYKGSISGTNDKPIYYAYDGETVYVYNYGGREATEENIGEFKLTKFTLTDANYNGMYRAMCGGADSNIDKNFRVSHVGLTVAGTYVLSADYFVANDASGEIQSQSYWAGTDANGKKISAWMELYQLNLTSHKFHTLNGGITAGKDGQPLLVDEWNTVTMIVTVKEDLTTSVDIYLNGAYCFSKNLAHEFQADSWILAKIGKPNLEQTQNMAGYIYIDNVKVNAVKYDEKNIVTVDASNVLGFDIDGKSIVNVSNSTELKLYVTESYAAYGKDFLDIRVGNIVTTTDKASIRLTDGTGLRFATEINASTLMFLDGMIASGMIESYNHGTLIAPTDTITDGKELSFEFFTEDVDMLDVESNLGKYYEVDDDVWTTHFAGSIINIKKANIDRAFSGRGYFQVTLKNGEVITYYSVYTHSISVAQQAQDTLDAIKNGESAALSSDTQLEMLENYASYLN